MANPFDGYSDEELESIASGGTPSLASPKKTDDLDFSSYSDDELAKIAGTQAEPSLTEEESFLRRIPDVGVSLVKGAVGLPETVVGLLDIMTQGYAGKGAEALGIRFKETQDILDSLYSSQQQAVNKEVADTKGFFPTIGKAIENPSFLLQTVAESAPSMIGAGGIGRGLIKFFPKLAPVIAGAIGEGVVSGGQAAEQIRQQTDTGLLNTTQAGAAGLSGMLTGVLGVVGGKLAKRLGIVDIDTLIAGGSVGAAVDDITATAKKGVLRKMLESAISEGALEELPQSAQEQMAQNVALGKPTFDGVAEAGAVGLLAGFVMGAGGGAGGHVMSGLEILEKDQVNQDKSKEIQTFVANQGYTDLNNTDLLQAYMESDTVLKDLPDDTALSDSMAVLKSELEKRGIWPEDKLSVDIETKMAELDEKLGGTVAESSDLVRKTEGGDTDVVGMFRVTNGNEVRPDIAGQKEEGQLQTETEIKNQEEITLPLFQSGEDIKTEPPMADASEKIASSPSKSSSPVVDSDEAINAFVSRIAGGEKMTSPEDLQFLTNNTRAINERLVQKAKAEKTPSTLPLTELSEEGMANPPSTPEKTSQEAIQEKTTVSDDFKDGKIKTLSGRVLAPPAIRTSSNVVATKDSKKADEWLRKEAIEEAKAKGDEFAGDQFKMANPAKMTQAEREGMHDYLFGETKNIFVLESEKPLKKKAKSATKILKVFPDKENGLEVHVAKVEKGFSVAVMDVDSGKFFDEVKIYPTDKKAIEAAKAIIKKPKPEKKPPPTVKQSLTVQKEETLESYARKHKINFNIPGHTNKEAISDGLLSYTKNDAIGLDKRAEEMQGLGLLGATPDGYATAGDYLYAELQKIVYNRINKKAESLTAEEDQAIKEEKEVLRNAGYSEEEINTGLNEAERNMAKEVSAKKDSEVTKETLESLDEDFVKEEETPADYRTIAKKVDAFADGSYTPEDLKEIVDNQTKLDELDAQVPVGTTIRIKTAFGESILHKSSKKESTYQISRFDTKGEAIGDSEYTDYQKAVKDLRHEQGSAVKAVDTLLPIIEKSKTEPETKTTSKELFDTSSMFTLSGSQPVEQKTMKVPEKKGERLLDVKKQTTDELKDRLSGEKAKRELEEGKQKPQSFPDFKSFVESKGKVLASLSDKERAKLTKEYNATKVTEGEDTKLKVYGITPETALIALKVYSKEHPEDIKTRKYLESLKVGTTPKPNLLSSKDSQALVSDILQILADGSTITFTEKIDPNRPDIQNALAQWKQGNPDAAFVIEGMHRKVIVDRNTMASLIEVSMGSSDIKATAWHEAWHSIDEIFLTANEKKVLAEKLTPDIEKQANIFAKYAANQKHLLPKSAKPIFERIREFFEKVGNYLKGRGFTNAEDVFNRALRGELKERTKRWTGDGKTAFQINVKHGSPFAFDRFTTDKVGSGEGAQMFGWGLYFTDSKGVAKYYAKKLGGQTVKFGDSYTPDAADSNSVRIINQIISNGNNKPENKEALLDLLKKERWNYSDDMYDMVANAIDLLEHDNLIFDPKSKNLYDVTLHKGKDPSEYHYMDWEKPVGSKVGTVIRNGLPEDFIEDLEDRWNASVEEWNGREAYDALARYAMEDALPGDTSMGGNPEKEASLFLLRNGIDGIKYPAGTLSGGKTDGFNYVVFDENAVTIEDRVSFKIAPVIKNLIGRNAKKAGNPESSFKDGEPDFKREFKEVLGKDYSWWKAHLYLPFFKGHGPNAEPMWKRAFDNTEAGREKRSDLNTHYVRKMHDFFDMPKEKTRNIEKVLSEGDAVLAQKIRDLTSEAISAKEGGNLELSQQLREQAQAIKTLNRYSDGELANGITLRTGEVVKLTPQEAKVYADVRTAFDEMHRDQFKHQIEMVFGKHKDKPWYSSMIDLFEDRPDSPEFTSDKRNTLKALNKLALGKIRGKKAETIAKNRAILMEALKSHISSVSGITDDAELNSAANGMLKAYQTEKVLMNAIKKARNRIGQQVAYFPRVREKGNVYLNIFKSETKADKNGDEKVFKTMIHSQVVKNAEEARELWGQYKLTHKNEDLSYELGAVNKETDSTYVGVNDMNLQRVIDNAIERIRSTRGLESGELLDNLKLSMVNAVANEMKSRGFGKSSITRRLNLIEGYKKTDLQKVALDYITGMTGMMTKQETAMNFHDILKDIPRDKPKLYNDIGKYAQDMLRNQNTLDRASGKARGVTFIYYLGGNLKSALIQLTQNHVTGIPKLAEKMREWGVKGMAEAKYHKAMADATTIRVNKDTGEVTGKRLNQWEKRLLTEFLHRGNTADQYMQYITGRMQNELGQKFGELMHQLSRPFGRMETFNRESASLAMFRMAWEHYSETIPDLEERYAKAYEEAKEYVNFTHFAYGKENLPRIATGGDLASVSARTLLTFRSFNHNYIQSIFGSKDWKTMAHSLAYVALFGGMMGLPFIKDLSDLLEKLTGKSYTKSAREVMRKFGGKTLETFGVQGLPALAGANISGSMAIGIPLVGETPTDTVTGVMGGMFNKGKKGVQYAMKGEAYKAAESILPEMVANPMKALRMSDVGKEYLGTPGYATTSSGKPIFDENGKPLKMTMTDMALKTIGINPSDYSMKNEAQRSASNIEEYFSDWKTSIYETYRAGRTSNDPKAISKALRQIREYNQAIIDKGAMGLISRIKMSNVVKASKVEMSKKQKREAQYKKNYLAS